MAGKSPYRIYEAGTRRPASGFGLQASSFRLRMRRAEFFLYIAAIKRAEMAEARSRKPEAGFLLPSNQ
jgi:hypothetical protein